MSQRGVYFSARFVPRGHSWESALLVVALLGIAPQLSGCSPANTPNDTPPANQPAQSRAEQAAEQPVHWSIPTASNQTPDVIVVGSGISGLSAALDLGRGGAK